MPFLALLALFLLAPSPSSAAQLQPECGIRLEGAELDFSGTEEDWLCGKEGSRAWGTIPLNQKRYFLRRFLQERGYHEPELSLEGDTLVARTGPQAEAKSFSVEGAPPALDPGKRRRLLGRALTPALLSETESWLGRELQELGYPCPEAELSAQPGSGAILGKVAAGEPATLGPIASEGGVDLPHQILDRYTAFVDAQAFDIRLLELSARRILAQDLYLSTYYDLSCEAGKLARITRRFVPAPPRLITAGVGFDTERGPLVRARYRRVRIGHAANIWENMLLATLREQTLETRFHWFFREDLASPMRLSPSLGFEREDEERFEATTYRFSPLFMNEWEKPSLQLAGELGPSFERTVTQRGPGERIVDSMRLVGRLRATSHLFEYYATSPREGWTAALDGSSRIGGFLSKESASRIQLSYDLLWNLGGFDPPWLVFGWRGLAGTFLLPGTGTAEAEVPPTDRFYLGGDADIRGFGRKELPGAERGFLTALYQGFELRAGEWWDVPLQPLVFLDLAKGGTKAGQLDRSLYLAPGIGLRYESFIGSLRATLGRGIVRNRRAADPEGGLQFFLSLGREF